jgi:HAD superfamily phosphatase (TIGR01681 family)
MTDLATANAGSAAGWLSRTSWQSAIFAAQLNRADLIQLKPGWACDSLRLNVHRNQPFEFIGSVLPKFLAYSGWSAALHYGPYDDSLSFAEVPPADAEIVWLDFDRYAEAGRGPSWFAWLQQRLGRLRATTLGPVLLLDEASPDHGTDRFNRELRKVVSELPGVHVLPQSMIAAGLTDNYIDRRLAGISGTQLSDQACLETARWLGLAWLPAALGVRIKCVVVDLDWTLYEGAIAEDGPDGIRISEAHKDLMRGLLQLRRQGIFLAALTRNDPADVEAFFEGNPEMPLKRSDLDAVVASWGSKARGLDAIADSLRIGTDSLLMVDDNAGEIAEAAASCSEAVSRPPPVAVDGSRRAALGRCGRDEGPAKAGPRRERSRGLPSLASDSVVVPDGLASPYRPAARAFLEDEPVQHQPSAALGSGGRRLCR